jgi:hypothetical protein
VHWPGLVMVRQAAADQGTHWKLLGALQDQQHPGTVTLRCCRTGSVPMWGLIAATACSTGTGKSNDTAGLMPASAICCNCLVLL